MTEMTCPTEKSRTGQRHKSTRDTSLQQLITSNLPVPRVDHFKKLLLLSKIIQMVEKDLQTVEEIKIKLKIIGRWVDFYLFPISYGAVNLFIEFFELNGFLSWLTWRKLTISPCTLTLPTIFQPRSLIIRKPIRSKIPEEINLNVCGWLLQALIREVSGYLI